MVQNGNGMHDYCETIIVNATHSGAWMSDPWKGAISEYHEPDETRQVFELEISHEGSGCDAQHWPKEKWKNDTQLVKIGRACYGCMACLLYTSPSPRDRQKSRMPSSA